MRCAEHLIRRRAGWAGAMLCVFALLGACAGPPAAPEPPLVPRPLPAPAPEAPVAPRAVAALPAAGVPVQEPARAARSAAPPADPAVQAAFDEALRALRAGRLVEAERQFAALARQHPDLAGAHGNLGLLYRRAGRLEESAAALRAAVQHAPNNAVLRNQLGVTLRALGRFIEARRAYEAAIDLDPGYAAAYLNLAILHDLYLGDAPRAGELYTRAAALLPAEAATINRWLAELKSRKADATLAGTPAPRKERE